MMQSLDFNTIGVLCVAVMVGSKWWWDYQKERRAREAMHEPRSNPPLHKQFVDRETYGKDQFDNNERHAAHAKGRKEIRSELSVVREDVASIKADNNNQTRELAKLHASIEAMPERLLKIIDRKSS